MKERIYIMYWEITLRKHKPYSLDFGKQTSHTHTQRAELSR